MLKQLKILLKRVSEPLFILFLIIASAVWYMINLNDTYQQDIKIPLHIDGIENPIHADGEAYFDVHSLASGKGYAFLLHNLFPKSRLVEINISDILRKDDGSNKQSISIPALENIVSNRLKDLTLIRIYDTNVDINLDSYTEKYIPISPYITHDLKGGYMQIGGTILDPCSVLIKGDRSIINSIDSLPTAPLKLTAQYNNFVGKVDIIPRTGVMIIPKEVTYKIQTDRFTELKVYSNIEIHTADGVSDSYGYTSIPSKVEICFNIAQSMGTTFTPSMYKPYIEYDPQNLHHNKNNQIEKNLYKVRVDELPIGVKVQYIQPQYITVLKNKR